MQKNLILCDTAHSYRMAPKLDDRRRVEFVYRVILRVISVAWRSLVVVVFVAVVDRFLVGRY